jgi:hypothetical protein
MLRTSWVVPLFILGASALIFTNVVLLGLGDSKFEPVPDTAFGFYLPIWLALYSPHILVGWVVLSFNVPPSRARGVVLFVFTFLVLTFLEASFILDAGVVSLVAQFFVALAVTFLARNWIQRQWVPAP